MTGPFVRPVRRVVAGVACVVLLTGVAGCTGDDNRPSQGSSSPVASASTGASPTLEAKPVPLQVRVTRVSGKLKQASRASLERNIGRTIEQYWDAAYLAGDYPRSDFGGAFATFSPSATRQARSNLGYLTNATLGPSTQAVAPREKKAWLSVLAPNKVAAGVTAKVRLVYVADRGEEPAQQVSITGRLLLTRKKAGGWQIFGYDVARSARPAEKGAAR